MAVKVDNKNVNGYTGDAERAFLLTCDEYLDQIAKSMVASAVEGQIDYFVECAEEGEFSTFKDAEVELGTDRMVELAIDMMKDHIGYFEKRLEAAIRRRAVTIESLKMTKEGIKDVDVNVE